MNPIDEYRLRYPVLAGLLDHLRHQARSPEEFRRLAGEALHDDGWRSRVDSDEEAMTVAALSLISRGIAQLPFILPLPVARTARLLGGIPVGSLVVFLPESLIADDSSPDLDESFAALDGETGEILAVSPSSDLAQRLEGALRRALSLEGIVA